jgi:hypothetical protein
MHSVADSSCLLEREFGGMTMKKSEHPLTIVTTADHDDRVVRSHSYKFIAEMQDDQVCGNPIIRLLRDARNDIIF